MPKLFEFGSLNENATLLTLDQVLQNVYLPILSYSGTRSEQGADSATTAEETPRRGSMGEASKGRVVIRDEFLINLQKFANHIGRTMQQLAGDIRLVMSDLVLTDDISELARNPEIVASLEQTLHDWEVTMASALEQQLNHTPQGNGTLAEMDFWRERNATLSALVEQLKRPLVEKVIAILSQTSSDSLSTFEYHKNELTKYYVEAKDNVRFLLTLERHFKNLAHGANFKVILETIPSLMNALRMVWIISRHYNRDERMVPLMERIAWELAERVAKVVNIRTILKESPATIKVKTSEAKRTLNQWKETYFETRAKIEASGRDARWEFDRKRLFERTDYMATICEDIHEVAQVLEEFYNIFGPELKAVTGDPKRIEDVVKRVDGLVKPLENVSFDPFNLRHSTSWRSVMDRFRREVGAIENEAKHFIDDSFQTLRSAEGAFDMLQNFKHIRSRDAINSQMMRKFNDILLQFGKEVDVIFALFKAGHVSPPVYKNQPPVAGAIGWERSLFYRIKHTILRFQEIDDMLNSDQGKLVSKKYLSVARLMKQYEDKKFELWREQVETHLLSYLKRNLLTRSSTGSATTRSGGHTTKDDVGADDDHISPVHSK
ncbi:dynein heavy chain 10, axonemal-like [Paramuricea clavata]|uniref:Dynein heavy chain 10, axonemal-like n=1 Tax=Paramuricea clavata TaxID=317549 RepID=A0A7D9J1Q9_PARCT|nr:dynein heavy chain 10, axonemal-like [Paramuricea clavata]